MDGSFLKVVLSETSYNPSVSELEHMEKYPFKSSDTTQLIHSTSPGSTREWNRLWVSRVTFGAKLWNDVLLRA